SGSYALGVVARAVARRGLQVQRALRDRWSMLHRSPALEAVEGIGAREERLLLASDEVVDQRLDAIVVHGCWGWRLGNGEPPGNLECGIHARQSYARCG